ncbi:MAG: c-type cytochrome biogenesis protein CcmI [Kordiimonadales bacterium]|nr:MAG: c-type cytochrome biogenesis protein CcmI [Kordiimonadales bacterium]
MIIWLLIASILALLAVLLLKGGREDTREADPVSHYRRQLVELDEEVESQTIDPASAAAAKLEIERRILKLADSRVGLSAFSKSGIRPVLLLVGIISVASLGLYAKVGSPSKPAQPSQTASLLDEPISAEGQQSFGDAISQLERRVEAEPTDKKALELLAKTARQVRVFSKAANAFGKLADLEPEVSRWRVQQLEAYIAMANGRVTPAADLILQDILTREPDHPAGQYYQALSHLQAGDTDIAIAIWRALKARSTAEAPWMPAVNQQLSQLGIIPPKITDEQIAGVAAMTPEEQGAFIQSMIDRLKSRLESAPDNPEGWLMLARSQASIGDKNSAIETINRAFTFVKVDNRADLQALLDNLLGLPNS